MKDILKRMEANLSDLWQQAMSAPSREDQRKLMARYRDRYRKYKKQLKFSEAMKRTSSTKGRPEDRKKQYTEIH